MSSNDAGQSTPTSAQGFSSMEGFLGQNPALKSVLEKSIREGNVCSVNLSTVELDSGLDTAPTAKTPAPKVK